MADSLLNGCCPRRRWGKTELCIPVMTLGSDGFSNKFGYVSDEQAMMLIRRAVDLGVNHFDCSRCYGDSLRKLGVAIKQGVVKREEIIINGRICCHGTGQWGSRAKGDGEYAAERADYSAGRVLPDIFDQLAILGIEHFDALLIHGPWPIEPTLAPAGTLEGLEMSQERGWVNFIGYGMHHPRFHLKAIESGRIDVLLTYSDYNLLSQDAADDVLPAAAAQDIGVLNAWSIREGLLTGLAVESLVPREKWGRNQKRASDIRFWCERRGINMLQLALQFCLREKRIHGSPIGCLNIEQLEMNVVAILDPLPEKVLSEFEQASL
jgi:aryl-alcohol dehydrogenase-like predicted oxidoreductase